MHADEVIGAGRFRRTMVTCGRGLGQAVRSLTTGIALFVASVVSIAYIPLGVGLVMAPASLLAVRGQAEGQRRRALAWSGVKIATPYRPRPAGARPALGWGGRVRECRWLLADPATWRDLLWILMDVPVGLVLGLLPACLVLTGVEGLVVAPVMLAFNVGGSLYWPIAMGLGLLALAVEPYLGPRLLKAHAEVSAALLAPTRVALDRRLDQVSETRSQVLDASAAELRRIERDLHDGAQARLAVLGLNIGLAEQLVREDPDLALELLAEARLSSGQALSELRDLVRGILPPVLVERGLDGAVRALALTLPLPVDVHVDLPGRLPAPVESATYFAVAEALANVVKHSGASRAWIQLHSADNRLVVIVGDDGVGGASPEQGEGLRGIERRLAAFDGVVAVTSPVGGPTVVSMELPCESS